MDWMLMLRLSADKCTFISRFILFLCVFPCVFLHLQELRVDLELRHRLALLGGGLSALLDPPEQVVDGAGNDTRLVLSDVDVEARSHGVRLPRTCLDSGKGRQSSVTLPNGNQVYSYFSHACFLETFNLCFRVFDLSVSELNCTKTLEKENKSPCQKETLVSLKEGIGDSSE